jgi:hypothetical protein
MSLEWKINVALTNLLKKIKFLYKVYKYISYEIFAATEKSKFLTAYTSCIVGTPNLEFIM